MEVLFCMENLNKMEFLTLSGVQELLKDIENSGNSWEYDRNIGKQGLLSETKGVHFLVITDSREAAQELYNRRICCIGYQDKEDTEFFSGASAVCYSFEDIDMGYLEIIHHHFYGIPVVIAETERLIIRESCKEDFEELHRISREAGNDQYMETMSEDYELEKEKFGAYISTVYNCFEFGLWTVIEKTNKEIIGRCGISVVADEISPEGRNELGYIIKQSYRKNGYGKEACEAILKYGIQCLHISMLYAKIHKDNTASKKLAEKLGFEFLEESDRVQIYGYSACGAADLMQPHQNKKC